MTDKVLTQLTDTLADLDASLTLIIVVWMGSRLPGHPGSIEDIG
jgi:hypothetical protein